MPSQVFTGVSVPLVASAARTTSSNTANLKDTTTPIPACDAATFILDVTAQTNNGTADNLQVLIDTSPDGGTTWYAAYAFAAVTGSTGQQRLDIRTDGVGLSEVGSTTANLKATTAINANTVTTRDMRIRWVAGTAGNFSSATFAVWGIFEPVGRRGF